MKATMVRTLLGTVLLIGIAPAVKADCFDAFAKRACGQNTGYTCQQKYKEVAACQQREKTDAAEAARLRAEQRAKKEAAERNALALIDKANKNVRKPLNDRRSPPAPSKPLKSAKPADGTSF